MNDTHMNDSHTTSTGAHDRHPRHMMDRRRFIGLSGGVAAAGLGYQFGMRRPATAEVSLASSVVPARAQVAAVGERILVSVQLAGGLDFLNTAVPLGSGRYRDLRTDGAISESDVVALDDSYGLYSMPNLAARWQTGSVALVHGVGWPNSTLSHFEAEHVWERGTVDNANRTGFLGRALDELGGSQDPMIGISIDRLSPSMSAPGWWPASLPADGAMPWTNREEWNRGLVEAAQMISQPQRGEAELLAKYRASHQTVFDLSDTVGAAFGAEEESESSWLGSQLATVADLITAGVATRAFHVSQDGYDTHADQTASLPVLLTELDDAIEMFFRRLGSDASKVTLMTWTEFGRRPEWNGSGTDHGTAGLQFVIGDAVRGGHHGEPPSLTRFDRDDNFVPTTDFQGYLGGVVGGVFDIDPRIPAPGVRRTLEVIT